MTTVRGAGRRRWVHGRRRLNPNSGIAAEGVRPMFRRLLRTWPIVLGLLVAAAGYFLPQQPVWRKPLPPDAELLGFSPDGKTVMVVEGVDTVHRRDDEPPLRPPALMRWDAETGAECRRQPVPGLVGLARVRPMAGGRYFEANYDVPDEVIATWTKKMLTHRVRVYDAETCKPASFSSPADSECKMSDDGSLAAVWRYDSEENRMVVVLETASGRELFHSPTFVPAAADGQELRSLCRVALDGPGRRAALQWEHELDVGNFVEIVSLGRPVTRLRAPLPGDHSVVGMEWHGDLLFIETERTNPDKTTETFRFRIDARTGAVESPASTGISKWVGPKAVACRAVLTVRVGAGSLLHARRDWIATESWRTRKLNAEPEWAKWLTAKLPATVPYIRQLDPHYSTSVALLDDDGKAVRWRGPTVFDAARWDFSPEGRLFVLANPNDTDATWVEVYSTAGRWRWPWLLAAPAGIAWFRRRRRGRRAGG